MLNNIINCSSPCWLWPLSQATGFGDRMGTLLALAAIGAAFGENVTVAMHWNSDPRVAGRNNPLHYRYLPRWTGYSYPLDEVRATLHTPPNVLLFEGGDAGDAWLQACPWDAHLSHTHGAVSPDQSRSVLPTQLGQVWRKLAPAEAPTPPPTNAQAWYHASARALRPTAEALRTLEAAIQPADLLLHVRAPDQNSYTPHSDPEAYFCTHAAVAEALRRNLSVSVLTDRPKWVARHLLTAGTHDGVRLLPRLKAWGAFALLLAGPPFFRGIIQHASEGWSAFSTVPAMARGWPLLNTYSNEAPGNRIHVMRAERSLPSHVYGCDGLADYFAAVSFL